MAKTAVSVSPLTSLKRVSMDGFRASRLNSVSMFFHIGSNPTDWTFEGKRCAYVRYNAPKQMQQSRLAEGAALTMFRGGLMTGDFYTRIDAAGDGVDIVALTRLEEAVYVSATSFFDMSIQPLAEQVVLVPGVGQFKPVEGGSIDREPAAGRRCVLQVQERPGAAADPTELGREVRRLLRRRES
jgi:hypothetical protein